MQEKEIRRICKDGIEGWRKERSTNVTTEGRVCPLAADRSKTISSQTLIKLLSYVISLL